MSWWSRLRDSFSAPVEPPPQRPALAAAALMMELARADFVVDERERQLAADSLRALFGVDRAELESLMAEAEPLGRDAVSLDGLAGTVAVALPDPEQRIQLLVAFWRIAQADGRVDEHEEYFLRKLVPLLRLGHADFIRAKLIARGEWPD